MRDFGLSILEHPAMGSMEPAAKMRYAEGFPSDGLGKRVIFNLLNQLGDILMQDLYKDPSADTSALVREQANVRAVLFTFWPNIDKDADNLLYLWPTLDSRSKGRTGRSATKIGRALRKMFPVLTDKEVEAITDNVKRKFFCADWTVRSGKERADFKHAYSSQHAETRNMDTTYAKKRLSDSCMRYPFDHLPSHPTEAYASGDFEIFWTENSEGHIGSRVVVSVAKGNDDRREAGPVYAVCEDSYQVLADHVKPLIRHGFAESDFTGLKLLSISYRDNTWIAPYLDLDPKYLTDTGDGFLTIAECGEITGSNYGGLQYLERRHMCEDCECTLDEDDIYHSPEGDGPYCHDCYYERWHNCENCMQDEPSNDALEVLISNRWSDRQVQVWCQDCVGSGAVIANDELWSDCSVTQLADGEFAPTYDIEDNYFKCLWNDEWYPLTEAAPTEDGELICIGNIVDYNYHADITGAAKWVFDMTMGHWFLEENKEGREREA